MAQHWYYEGADGQVGPVEEDEIRNLLDGGSLLWTARVWNETMADWAPAAEVLASGAQEAAPLPDEWTEEETAATVLDLDMDSIRASAEAGPEAGPEEAPEQPAPTAQPQVPIAVAATALETTAPAEMVSVDGGLRHGITHRPDFAMLKVELEEGEKVLAEPSAMATMDAHIELKSGLKGGLLKSIGRAFGGESMIVNTFTAVGAPGEVVFAPGPMGDMEHVRLKGNRMLLQRGAYVASSEDITIDGKWDGFRGFFSGEGMVLLQAQGDGDLWFNTYGAMLEIDVKDGYYVDTGYIVAFDDTRNYEVTVLPGLGIGGKIKSFFFGGEGLVCRFSGQGKLWIQTRTINPFLSWVHPYRSAEKSN
jgi:uncharacterized protein (TIGR00266 family)